MPTDTLPELSREDYLAMLRSPDSPDNLEWKISPTGIVDADADTGVVTAIVAVTGIVDEVNDIIVPGAFRRTLAQRIPKGVWSHDIHTWVSRTDGIGELMPGDPRLPAVWKGNPWPKEAGALLVKTAFNLGTLAGRDAYSNVVFFDAGPLGPQVEWSIGYNSIPGLNKRDRKGIRSLEDVDLYEYGPVLFGAMPLAGTVGTKARGIALERKGAVVTESTIIGNLELKVAGKEASPKDVKNTEKLKQYWEHGAGAAKIRWGEPGDFNRCVAELSKYLPPNQVKGYCANRHKGATGGWPGHAPGVEQAEADAKKAAKESKDAGFSPEAELASLLDGLEGKADKRPGSMTDGSFPITDGTSLKKAIKAHGRAKDPEKAKRHIKRRAKAIGCEHMIPDEWKGTKDAAIDTLETDAAIDDDGGLTEAVAAVAAFEALGFTDPEVDAALADDGEFTALPDDLDGDGEPGDGDGDGDATGSGTASASLGIDGEHKAARSVSALSVGDRVLELKHASGVAAGEVTALARRGSLIGLGIKGAAGLQTVWVPGDAKAQVAYDPYAELKSGLEAVAERKDYPYLRGSVEERQDEIKEAVRDLLLPEPDEGGQVRAYVSLDATFADYVVATLNDYSMPGPDDEQSFVIPYTVGADGAVELGQPAPVEKQVVLVPGGDADDGDDGDTTPKPPGGMDPSLQLARKIASDAKALLDTLEQKAAAGGDVSGTHVRRLRQVDEAIVGALSGLGTGPQEGKGAQLGEVADLLARAALL